MNIDNIKYDVFWVLKVISQVSDKPRKLSSPKLPTTSWSWPPISWGCINGYKNNTYTF